MVRITRKHLEKLPFGSIVKVEYTAPHPSINGLIRRGVIFGDKLGYEDGVVDDLSDVADYIDRNLCIVFLIRKSY